MAAWQVRGVEEATVLRRSGFGEKAGPVGRSVGQPLGGDVRGHDQSNRRVHCRAWFGLILAATATVLDRPVRGQGGSETEPPAARAPAPSSIDLAGRRVRVWARGDDRWALLSGQAAVFQDADGLRAEEIVVRIKTIAAPGGAVSYRLDIYAEGLPPAPGQPAKATLRRTLATNDPPHLKAYNARGFVALDAPPLHDAVLARSGLPPAPVTTTAYRSIPVTPSSSLSLLPSVASQPAEPSPTAAAPPDVVVVPDPPAASEPAPQSGQSPTQNAGAAAPKGPRAKIDGAVNRAQYREEPPEPARNEGELPPVVEAQAVNRNGGGLPPVLEADDVDNPRGELPPPAEVPVLESAPTVPLLPGAPARNGPATELAPLPAPGSETTPAPPADPAREKPKPRSEFEIQKEKNPFTPLFPSTPRITSISPRNGGPNYKIENLPTVDGTVTTIIRGGVHIVTSTEKNGDIDMEADNVIIWRRLKQGGKEYSTGPNGEQIEDANAPIEIYLEGNVMVRQDERKIAGTPDQRSYRAAQACTISSTTASSGSMPSSTCMPRH